MIFRCMRYLTFALALGLIAMAVVYDNADARNTGAPSGEKAWTGLSAGGSGCPAPGGQGSASDGCTHRAAENDVVAKLEDGGILAQGCCGGGQDQGGHDHGGQQQGGDATVQAKLENGVQTARIRVSGTGYSPSKVRVRAGLPVRLVFVGDRSLGCADRVVFPTLGLLPTTLKAGGETVVSFTPATAGRYAFTCPMGMTKGEIIVE